MKPTPIPEGDRFSDTLKFRRIGEGGGHVLYECWDEAVLAIQKQAYEDGLRDAIETTEYVIQVWADAPAKIALTKITEVFTASQKRDE